MKTIFEESGLLTIEQAADCIGVTLSTFRQNYSLLFKDVKVKSGKRVYIPKEALQRLLPEKYKN
jgi:hypothetical protein